MNYLRAARPPQPQGRGRRWASVFLALTMSLGAIVFATPPASADCYYQDPYTLLWIECALVEGEYEPGYDAAWTEYYEENSHNAGNSSSNNSGTSTGSSNNGDSGEAPAPTPETDPCKIEGLDKLCQACKHEKDPCDASLKSILTSAEAFANEFCGTDPGCRLLAILTFTQTAYLLEAGKHLSDDLIEALLADFGQESELGAQQVMLLDDLASWVIDVKNSQLFDNDAERSQFIRKELRAMIQKIMTEAAQGDGSEF